jgi:hypothetical protein
MDTRKDLNQDRPIISSSGPSDSDRPASPSGKSPETILADIERTREKTIRTINELERRLSPSRLMADVKEMTRQATSGRANVMAKETGETTKRWGAVLYDTFVSNPIPTMLIGGGLAWLIASEIRKEESDSYESVDANFVERRRTVGTDATGTYGMGFIDRRKSPAELMERSRAKAGEKAGELKGKAREARESVSKYGEQVRSKASHAGEQVRSKASHAGEQVRHKAEEISASAAQYGRRAQDSLMHGTQSAKSGFFHTLENNPLAVAGVAMVAGAAIGLMVPETRYEEEAMGAQRDEMFERVREAGREKVEQVEAVVREAKESAKDEAERQGLVSRESADKAESDISRASKEFESHAKDKGFEFKEKASREWESTSEQIKSKADIKKSDFQDKFSSGDE